eukprot:TRINITY_DN1616_c0_g2_i2.p4 TRINITY_DN1616_c0_g2~~TRINITY_DN1616_c0_g2_i2.p4  ORF type:complete len:105 (+),score=26.08 TRINITY_DN1616_c0_g2_i2:85-399(+)
MHLPDLVAFNDVWPHNSIAAAWHPGGRDTGGGAADSPTRAPHLGLLSTPPTQRTHHGGGRAGTRGGEGDAERVVGRKGEVGETKPRAPLGIGYDMTAEEKNTCG